MTLLYIILLFILLEDTYFSDFVFKVSLWCQVSEVSDSSFEKKFGF